MIRWGSVVLGAVALSLLAPAGGRAAVPLRPAATPYRIVVLPVQQRGAKLPPRRGVLRTFRRARAWFRRESGGRIALRFVLAPPADAATVNPDGAGRVGAAQRLAAARGVDVAGRLPVLIEASPRRERSFGNPGSVQIRGRSWRSVGAVVHELGHGLGLDHARAPTACRRPFAPQQCLRRPRQVFEYGDLLDIMGLGVRHLGGYARLALGLAPPTDAPPRSAVTALRPLEARRPTVLRLRTAAHDYLVDTRRGDADRALRRRLRAPRGVSIVRVRARYAPAGTTTLAGLPVDGDGGGSSALPRTVRVPATDPERPCRAGTPGCLARQVFRPGHGFAVPGAFRLRVLGGGGAVRVATRWLDRTPPSLTVVAAHVVRPPGAPAQLALGLRTAARGAGVARIQVEQGGAVTAVDADLSPGLVAGPRGRGTIRVPLGTAPVARVRAVDAAGNASAWAAMDLTAMPSGAGATVAYAPAAGRFAAVAPSLAAGEGVTLSGRTDPALAGAPVELEVVGSSEAPTAIVAPDGSFGFAWTAPEPGLFLLRVRVPVARAANEFDLVRETYEGWYRG